MSKKEIRKTFRTSVMKRDKYRCVCCGKCGKDRQGGEEYKKFHQDPNPVNLDAHHITDRNELPNGGYNILNGISVCDTCHLLAEVYHQTGEPHPGFAPDDLYEMINSSYEEAIKASERLK